MDAADNDFFYPNQRRQNMALIHGTKFNNLFNGTDGDDLFAGLSGDDPLNGGAGRDTSW